MIIEIGDVLVSMDIITEKFCCDLSACKGACCVEGDAGAPVSMDEIADIEQATETVWNELPASSQAVIDKQGVAYCDREGDLVTSIVSGRECVFCHRKSLTIDGNQIDDCCLCALEGAYLDGRTTFRKPMSCSLYPIREKRLSDTTIGLNYHKWAICKDAVKKGRQLDMPVYKFLREPLTRRFGEAWYEELETVARELKEQGIV